MNILKFINFSKLGYPDKNINIFFIFIICNLSIAILYHGTLVYFGFHYPNNTFLFNPADRWADWSNSVAQSSADNPYMSVGPAPATYFPFAYIFFQLGLGAHSIIKYLLISIFLSITSIYSVLIGGDTSLKCTKSNFVKLFLGTLLCYPVIFSLDRGNIDFIISMLCIIFIATINNRLYIIGILSLGVAISLKGYPAAFLLLLLSERKYLRFLFCLAIVFVLTLIPLFCLWDGIFINTQGLLTNLSKFHRLYIIGSASLFASSDPYNTIRLIIFEILNLFKYNYPIESVSYQVLKFYKWLSIFFASLITLFVLIPRVEFWRKIASICFLTILFPNVANDYKLCMLLPSLYILLLDHIKSKSQRNVFIISLLLLVPKSYLFIHGKPISMIINPILLVMGVYYIFSDSFFYINFRRYILNLLIAVRG